VDQASRKRAIACSGGPEAGGRSVSAQIRQPHFATVSAQIRQPHFATVSARTRQPHFATVSARTR